MRSTFLTGGVETGVEEMPYLVNRIQLGMNAMATSSDVQQDRRPV